MKLLLIAVMASVLAGCVGYAGDRGPYYDRDGYNNGLWFGGERYEGPGYFDHDRRDYRPPHDIGPRHENHGEHSGQPPHENHGGHSGPPSHEGHSGHSGPPSHQNQSHRPS